MNNKACEGSHQDCRSSRQALTAHKLKMIGFFEMTHKTGYYLNNLTLSEISAPGIEMITRYRRHAISGLSFQKLLIIGIMLSQLKANAKIHRQPQWLLVLPVPACPNRHRSQWNPL